MTRIRKKTAPSTLARQVRDEVLSLRHNDQIDMLTHDPHLARDLGLDHARRPARTRLPWILPF